MSGKIPKSLWMVAATIAVMAVTAASASAMAVYNNFPNPKPGNVGSIGFEATSTSEFGGQVEFGGLARKNPRVSVIMSSWACQNLQSGANCKTTPKSTFSYPITLNVYEVGAGEEPGAKIGSITQTFNIPFRPSASKNCSVTSEGVVGWSKECFSGKAFKLTFEPLGITLPQKAILSIAYNTTNYGYAPTHSADVGEDSLNLGLTEPANPEAPSPVAPSVGSDPLPAYTYVNSTYLAMYEPEPHGTIGTFSLANGWTGYQPLFKVFATR